MTTDGMSGVADAMRSALRKSELSVRNWIGGRVPPTAENREHFVAMRDAARSACELLPAVPAGTIDPVLRQRMTRVREWLEVIVEAGLAQEAIDALVSKIMAQRED
jgi:hypothetical protein